MDEGFRTFDHTGDLGLEAWAATPEALFARAAEGLMRQIAESPGGGPPVRLSLEIRGDDAADLLVHWLNTVLLEAETRRVLWTRAEVLDLGPGALAAALEGEPLDPGRMTFLREVKAVSHHALELDLTPGACRCRLVLDI